MGKWLEHSLLKSAFRWGREKEKAFYKSHLLASLHFCLKQFQKQTPKSSWLADPAPRFSHSAGHTRVSLTHGFVPGQHSALEQEDTVLGNQPSTTSRGPVLSPSFFTCKWGSHICFTGLGKDQRRKSCVPRQSEAGMDYFIIKKHVFLSENDPKFVYFMDCFVLHQRRRFCFHKPWLWNSLSLLKKLRVGRG